MDLLTNDPLAWVGIALASLMLGLYARRLTDALDRIGVAVEQQRDDTRELLAELRGARR